MKKFLSIVISILMISAMMSVVALADAATISLADVSGLVANEKVSLTPTVSGAAEYTVDVDANAFTVTGGTTAEGISSKTVTAGEAFELVVNASIPATFTSKIRLTAGGTQVKVNVSVADRLVGDVTGDGAVNGVDAAQVLRYAATLSVANANIGTAYIGGNTGSVSEDIFGSAAVTTPLAAPANPVAYYSNGKVYYEFDAVANASSYTITVGSDTFTGITATSGSVTLSGAWNGTDTFNVVAVGDGVTYSDSTAATATITNAPVGAFSAWVTTNGGLDAVTVYELN
jgi:hypothetical protein